MNHDPKPQSMMKTTLKAVVALHLLAPGWALAVDLSQVPQIHETAAQRDERMQWFRDAKFGMFIHWGPCSVGSKEIGWDDCGGVVCLSVFWRASLKGGGLCAFSCRSNLFHLCLFKIVWTE